MPENSKTEIIKEAERVHESAIYSSETQFEYAKRWRRVDRLIGALAAVIAAVAGVGGLSNLMSAKWVGLIAILAAVTGAIAASIGAPQTKEKSAFSANAYRALQQDARIFITVDAEILSYEEARSKLEELVSRLQKLNAESEIPSNKAFKRAKKQIDSEEHQNYKVDRDADNKQSF
jgi:hypothetical protein